MKPLHVNSWDLYNKCLKEAKIRIAVDVGANSGGYSSTLLEHGFAVHLFEPQPTMFKQCRSRFDGNEKVFLNQMGVSDQREVLKNVEILEAWTIGRVGETVLQKSPNPEVQETFDMTTITLDEYLGGTRIGILKLDVDGYEFKVLRGAVNTLRRDKPPILCEFSCYLHKMFGKDAPEQMVNYIFNLGYRVVSCDGLHELNSWLEIKPQWPWTTSFDVMLMPK